MGRNDEEDDEYEEDEEGYDEDDDGDDDEEEEDEEEEEEGYEENLVFVIMPFAGEDMDDVYSAIRGACSRIGLNAQRVTERVGAKVVLDDIENYIDDAEFIICDLTRERPNVYYELGYARAGNEEERILLIAKEGTTLHFDIIPLRVHFYRSTEHLRQIVTDNLKAMRKITRSWE